MPNGSSRLDRNKVDSRHWRDPFSAGGLDWSVIAGASAKLIAGACGHCRGLAVGIGGFTFFYAKGAAYLIILTSHNFGFHGFSVRVPRVCVW